MGINKIGGGLMKVKDIMTRKVITVLEEFTVEDCARLLSDNSISGLPVVDDSHKVTGMVTEGDLIRRAANLKGPSYLEILGGIIYLDTPKDLLENLRKSMGRLVRDVMTREVELVNENKTVEEVATILVEKKLKRLPVVDDDNHLVGIVSRKDILHYLYKREEPKE